MYLAQVPMSEYTQYKERTYKWTTAMGKESAVTETIKTFTGNNLRRESASNINLTPTPRARPYRIGKNRTVYVMRRRVTRMLTEGKDPRETAILAEVRGDEAKLKFEGLREPYWEGGDYVFLRTGSPTTRPPRDPNPIQLFRNCDRSCNYYFKTYGRVCGHRYSQKKFLNYYKDFANICDIDHENCKDTLVRPNWHPMYRGNCSELRPFATMVYDYFDVVPRGKKFGYYTFTRRTPTQATRDIVDLEIEELKRQQYWYG